MWITPDHRGRIKDVLGTFAKPYVRLIVVTDGERILGLGDQGAGGMVIPIGKLSLYAACAGLHPSVTQPIAIDIGTDNRHLLDDPLYLGYPHERLRGEEYYSLIDEFVEAVKECFPEALLQWEDFKKVNAFDLLAKYRDELLSFNDDIQGTAAVTIAGLVAACRVMGGQLSEQKIAILGGGAAGVGIAQQLRGAFEREGKSADEITRSIAILDSRGLIHTGREGLDEHKKEFAWPHELATEHDLIPEEKIDLEQLVAAMKPTMLLGISGVPGTFTEGMIREMAKHCERPVIFPMSNPTDKTEAFPVDLVEWTEGRALIATGSPFEPIQYEGRTIHVSQANNVYIFPGVGLGALAARANKGDGLDAHRRRQVACRSGVGGRPGSQQALPAARRHAKHHAQHCRGRCPAGLRRRPRTGRGRRSRPGGRTGLGASLSEAGAGVAHTKAVLTPLGSAAKRR